MRPWALSTRQPSAHCRRSAWRYEQCNSFAVSVAVLYADAFEVVHECCFQSRCNHQLFRVYFVFKEAVCRDLDKFLGVRRVIITVLCDQTQYDVKRVAFLLQGSVRRSVPLAVVGSGRGGDCAPRDANYSGFYEACSAPAVEVCASSTDLMLHGRLTACLIVL